MNFKNLFQNFCKKNNLEINSYQLVIIDELESFYKLNFNISDVELIVSDYFNSNLYNNLKNLFI